MNFQLKIYNSWVEENNKSKTYLKSSEYTNTENIIY